ncbi:hypothetical protein LZ31DRAFT_377081 [Colletotrichum somersetense]|nr:hypothetical protein LZ31DRAFT_377081 [Colletotrichum somersetense]
MPSRKNPTARQSSPFFFFFFRLHTPPVTHFIHPVPGLACKKHPPRVQKSTSDVSPVRPQQKRRRGNRGTAQFHQPPRHQAPLPPPSTSTTYSPRRIPTTILSLPDFTYTPLATGIASHTTDHPLRYLTGHLPCTYCIA